MGSVRRRRGGGRVGCGRVEGEDKQSDPKAVACRRTGVLYAVAAGVCLVVNIVLGAISKMA